MARPRALLTGCSGFTGHYVALELAQAGYEVYGLSNHGGDGGDRAIRANLLDRAAVKTAVDRILPDVVLHLAAIAFVAHGDVDEMYRVNVFGTRNLLDAIASSQKKPEVVVLASSANIYGNAGVEPITESTPAAPANDYAVSKLAMEYMAWLWADKLPIVITRPFNYTGVGQSAQFLIPKIVSHFRKGERTIELGNLDVTRDFSDVRYVARVYRELLEAKPIGKTLNICSGRGYSLASIIDMLTEIFGRGIDVRVNSEFVRAGEVKRLIGSSEALEGIAPDLHPIGLKATLTWMASQA